jgi:hypothetical protein
LYLPQALQTLWGKWYAPQLGHATMLGALSFQWDERRLSLLAFECFLFGTAMVTPPSLLIRTA